jgi:transcriptional regulator with XRE-family HTH domain
MSTRERPIDRGHRLAAADRLRVGHELRMARQIAGRSLASVARSSGLSKSQASRIERAEHPSVSVDQLARLGAAVGLDVRVRAYPGPDLLLDAGQLALIGRLRERLAPQLTFRTEVPLPTPGDQRAWDGVIGKLVGHTDRLPVEAETRWLDAQAQLRRLMLKLRDSGFQHVLLVLADTKRNRQALAAAGSILLADFPVPSRGALAALARGEHPGGSAIVLL